MSVGLILFSITVTLALSAIALVTLAWMLDAYRTPESFDRTHFVEVPGAEIDDQLRRPAAAPPGPGSAAVPSRAWVRRSR